MKKFRITYQAGSQSDITASDIVVRGDTLEDAKENFKHIAAQYGFQFVSAKEEL